MNNWDIINLANTIRNKNVQGGDIRADQWQTLINANSQKLFAGLLGVPNLYQLDAPIERRGANLSRAIDLKLRPFYKRETVSVVGGVADFSTKNIGYLLNLSPSTATGRPFDELTPYELDDRLSSAVVAPTTKDPAFTWRDGSSIFVYPASVNSVVLSYYQFPTEAVVLFTTNSVTLLEEYDETNSVETGWNDSELMEITYMILRDLGVNMQRQDILAYAQQRVTNE